jgi:methionyl-tRNA formyltransferase
MKIGIILTPDNRSKAYIQKILKHKILLNEIIFLNDLREEKNVSEQMIKQSKINEFDVSESVSMTLKNGKLNYKEFNFVDINKNELIKYIKEKNIDFFIFTGGGILKQEILSLRTKFIHFHPGIVPNYKGSTCFYYSILEENNCGVTAFIMNEGLDTGNILHQKVFDKPKHCFVDEIYDPHIRSETLIDVLKNDLICKNKFKKQDPNKGNTYYVIHPVLKHIAILNCIESE